MARTPQRPDFATLCELALDARGEREGGQAPGEAPHAAQEELAGLRVLTAWIGLATAPLRPSDDLRRRVLASAARETRFEGFVGRMARLFDLSEARARGVLACIDHEAAGWVTPPFPGARLLHFQPGPAAAGAHCGLVELAPGADFPLHEHPGAEWTLSLQGRGLEDGGRIFEPGDLVCRTRGSSHSLRSIGSEPYVFAVALRVEAPREEEPGAGPART